MTFYYKPTVAEALSSVQYIMNEVNFGWLIRSIHRWSASMMVLMMILHVFRVYLTGGFKKPRELTWVTGVVLAVITVSFGVTGYSLPWDQVDLRAIWMPAGGKYTVIAYVKNLLDEDGYAAAVASAERNNNAAVPSDRFANGARNYELTPPRIVGVEVQYRF